MEHHSPKTSPDRYRLHLRDRVVLQLLIPRRDLYTVLKPWIRTIPCRASGPRARRLDLRFLDLVRFDVYGARAARNGPDGLRSPSRISRTSSIDKNEFELRPPVNFPYGEPQYTAIDPGGAYWTFSQSPTSTLKTGEARQDICRCQLDQLTAASPAEGLARGLMT
jgi:hypothetical protein